ncbi:MAG: RNA methyltransferase [archaeon]
MISVILYEPQKAGNVGSVCRAMKNFGAKNLVMVNPCKLDDNAAMMAVHAKEVLEKAKTFESFEEAKKNFDLTIATTARVTGKDDYFLKIPFTPEELRKKLEKVEGKIAIVFGPEDSGLPNEIVEQCDMCVTIPTHNAYRSMNLSHAVAVVLYELSKLPSGEKPRLASGKELSLIKENFSEIVKGADYPADKRKVFNSMIRKLIGRAQVTGREANTLIGVLKKIRSKIL